MTADRIRSVYVNWLFVSLHTNLVKCVYICIRDMFSTDIDIYILVERCLPQAPAHMFVALCVTGCEIVLISFAICRRMHSFRGAQL